MGLALSPETTAAAAADAALRQSTSAAAVVLVAAAARVVLLLRIWLVRLGAAVVLMLAGEVAWLAGCWWPSLQGDGSDASSVWTEALETPQCSAKAMAA